MACACGRGGSRGGGRRWHGRWRRPPARTASRPLPPDGVIPLALRTYWRVQSPSAQERRSAEPAAGQTRPAEAHLHSHAAALTPHIAARYRRRHRLLISNSQPVQIGYARTGRRGSRSRCAVNGRVGVRAPQNSRRRAVGRQHPAADFATERSATSTYLIAAK